MASCWITTLCLFLSDTNTISIDFHVIQLHRELLSNRHKIATNGMNADKSRWKNKDQNEEYKSLQNKNQQLWKGSRNIGYDITCWTTARARHQEARSSRAASSNTGRSVAVYNTDEFSKQVVRSCVMNVIVRYTGCNLIRSNTRSWCKPVMAILMFAEYCKPGKEASTV